MEHIFSKTEFSPKNEPHTAKLSFSAVLKHFRWKLTNKFSFKVKKVIILERR